MEDLRVASSEKCPLCGGSIILGECSFCGYAVPDTEKLSAVYDLSPDNVVFGDTEAPDDAEDSIPAIELPDVPSSPMAKLNETAAIYPQKASAAVKNTANAANETGTAYNANAAFVPYTKPDYGTPAEPADTSDIPAAAVKAVSDFTVKNWWKFLLTAILPSVGYAFAFFYIVINMDKDRKKDELFFAGAILLTTIILQAADWDPTGFDILIQYFTMEILTRGRYHRYS